MAAVFKSTSVRLNPLRISSKLNSPFSFSSHYYSTNLFVGSKVQNCNEWRSAKSSLQLRWSSSSSPSFSSSSSSSSSSFSSSSSSSSSSFSSSSSSSFFPFPSSFIFCCSSRLSSSLHPSFLFHSHLPSQSRRSFARQNSLRSSPPPPPPKKSSGVRINKHSHLISTETAEDSKVKDHVNDNTTITNTPNTTISSPPPPSSSVSTPSQSPPPQPHQPTPPPTPPRSGLAGAIAEGMAHGVGWAFGQRAVDALMGPRVMEMHHSNDAADAAGGGGGGEGGVGNSSGGNGGNIGGGGVGGVGGGGGEEGNGWNWGSDDQNSGEDDGGFFGGDWE